MTKGLRRVRPSFNPSGNPAVTALKARAAELIDLIETIPAEGKDAGDVARLKNLAQTAAEQACDWAVKAATHE